MRTRVAAVLMFSSSVFLAAQESKPAPRTPATQETKPSAARPDDVKSMEAIVAALYDVISGPAGQKRDWDRFRSLFVPGARLIPATPPPNGGPITARVLDPDGYVQRAGAGLEQRGFFEHEIAHKVDAFGNIAHVFSTYESRHAQNDPTPFARGINSIQLLKDGSRWWIVTVYWDSERPDNPLPAEYLPKKPG